MEICEISQARTRKKIPVSEVHQYLDLPAWSSFVLRCMEIAKGLENKEVNKDDSQHHIRAE